MAALVDPGQGSTAVPDRLVGSSLHCLKVPRDREEGVAEAFGVERAANALVADWRSNQLRGVSLFYRPDAASNPDTTLASAVSWRTYDQLALSAATGWSNIALASRLHFT